VYLLPVGLATVVCEKCRPIELQNAPGSWNATLLVNHLANPIRIGIDLPLDYGYSPLPRVMSLS